ncbi:hypothetical protein AB0E01_43695 [Nocardia vinacea]|uniref:hypothetical protein n=1 Tax=Nocardia vinacea TaxID=96468 RepID=UPI0033D233E2
MAELVFPTRNRIPRITGIAKPVLIVVANGESATVADYRGSGSCARNSTTSADSPKIEAARSTKLASE